MRLLVRTGPRWQLATQGVLVSVWLGLSGLLVVARGNPEAFLATTFGRFSRDDAFEHLNRVLIGLWSVHSFLVLIAITATWHRRTDVLAVLIIGPVLALAIALLSQRWADPNWFQVVAVCAIGWLVGTVVGGLYWVLKPGGVRPHASLQQTRPAATSERTSSGANGG
jgi:hypothetical protein